MAIGGTPHLVRDINATPVPVSSGPTEHENHGSSSVFTANDGVNGFEPWISNGTSAGTFLWGDTNPGISGYLQNPSILASGRAYRLAPGVGSGTSIWVTDYTVQGSRKVLTIPDTVNAGVTAMGALGANLLLQVAKFDVSASELWVSDGTAAGTQRLATISTDGGAIIDHRIIGNRLYFVSSDLNARYEFWRSDGTASGTQRIGSIPNAIQTAITYPSMSRVGNFILFTAPTAANGMEIWRLDTVTNQISLLADIAPGAADGIDGNSRFGELPNLVLFTASPAGDGTRELWRTDGTQSGTFRISTTVPNTSIFYDFVVEPTLGKALFFPLNDANQLETWATDGTAAGTVKIHNSASGVNYTIGGHFYFQADVSGVFQLWTSDGTLATTRALPGLPASGGGYGFLEVAGDSAKIFVRVPDANAAQGRVFKYDLATSTATLLTTYRFSANGAPTAFGVGQGLLYFDNEDSTRGREIWVSDGTPSGTRLLKNIATETQTLPSDPRDFVDFRGTLYFTADDGVNGREIWRSDGSVAGTQLMMDVNPGATGSTPSDLFVANDTLYFFAIDSSGISRLWRSGGTAATTVPVAAVSARPDTIRTASCSSKGIAIGSNIFFGAFESQFGMQLWKFDTNAQVATRLTSNNNGSFGGFGVCSLTSNGSLLFFSANGNSAADSEVWISDGTSAGTRLLLDIVPGFLGSSPQQFVPQGRNVLFLANAGTGQKVWVSDGTTAGTRVLTNMGTGNAFDIRALPNTSRVLATVGATGNRRDLWAIDATTLDAVSLNVTNLDPIPTIVGNRALFLGSQVGDSTSAGLWGTDGTVAGTARVRPGVNPDLVLTGSLFEFNGIGFYRSLATPSGPIQWMRTNGTANGTVNSQSLSNLPNTTRYASGQNLFYVSSDGFTGNELFALDNQQPQAVADSGLSLATLTSLAINVLSNDIDPDGALKPGSVSITTPPQRGTASVSANGVVTYSSNVLFAGQDSFAYTVTDDQGFVSLPATVQLTVTAAVPTVTLTADPTSLTAGQSTILNWSSTLASSCSASNAWSGSQNPSGQQVLILSGAGAFTYTLTCTGPGGSASASATVNVNPLPSQGGGGGGGAVDSRLLLVLLIMIALAPARRRLEPKVSKCARAFR